MTEETIFAAALEKQPEQRAAFLAEACGDDSALRKGLDGLLAASEKAGNFMAHPVVASSHLPDSATEILEGNSTSNEVTVARDVPGQEVEDHSEDLAFLTPSSRPDSLGRIGHYEVLQVLGRGGFGIVFRAFDDMLQRVVAVKVMAPQWPPRRLPANGSCARPGPRRRCGTRTWCRCTRSREQPLPYLVMEFIPGETLQQKLDRTGPLDVPEVLRIGRQIAEGLAAAHATDLIHRDIKPGNVLLEGGSSRR